MPGSDEETLGEPSIRPIASDTHHQREFSEDTPLLRAATDVPYYHSTQSPDETFRDHELAADVELGADDETRSEYENRLEQTISYSSQTGIEPGSLESPMLRDTSRRRQPNYKTANGIRGSRRGSADTGDGNGQEQKSPFHGGISYDNGVQSSGYNVAFPFGEQRVLAVDSFPVDLDGIPTPGWPIVGYYGEETAVDIWDAPVHSRNPVSYINIVYGLGSALGVATGGAMADHLGWRWEFGIQVPALVLILATSCIFVPRGLGLSDNKENESFLTAMKTFDYKGSLVLTAGTTFLILSLSLGGNIYPWTHPLVLTALSIFVVSTPLLIYLEYHAPRPIMPLYLFTRAPRSNLIFSNFVSAITINAIIFNMPIFFQAVRLETATSSGLRLLVSALAGTICGVSTGFLITWSRRLKWPLVLGAALVFLGPVTLTTINKDMSIVIILVFLALGSMGQGFQFPGTFMAILAVSDQTEQAVVTSTLMLWRSLGTVIGVASSSLVLQNALVQYLDAFVSGPDKAEVIRKVRGSIEAIVGLDPHYRDQVVAAYSASLRATFITASGIGLITLLLVVPIRMPRLGKRN
ncbi:hypothetical protein V492_00352 [Pseudogymnoascus sp. VKM F-4246]|nr:hypothetical protein V492_00352 [Pseudogymnoascus sp. VKM F-4246]